MMTNVCAMMFRELQPENVRVNAETVNECFKLRQLSCGKKENELPFKYGRMYHDIDIYGVQHEIHHDHFEIRACCFYIQRQIVDSRRTSTTLIRDSSAKRQTRISRLKKKHSGLPTVRIIEYHTADILLKAQSTNFSSENGNETMSDNELLLRKFFISFSICASLSFWFRSCFVL